MKHVAFYIIGASLVIFIIYVLNTVGSGGYLNSSNFMSKYKSTPGAIILDVRTPYEFDSGHIVNAKNLDFEDPNFKNEVKKLDKNTVYFVYCRSGNRSAQAVTLMKNSGIKKIYELQGGINGAPSLIN